MKVAPIRAARRIGPRTPPSSPFDEPLVIDVDRFRGDEEWFDEDGVGVIRSSADVGDDSIVRPTHGGANMTGTTRQFRYYVRTFLERVIH